ncbi:MAG TPA: hypothetical protein PLP17_01875, partial [Oligoflexia bacterium]|nr:hypothetical protein [Oligoflexia bacterium]
GNPYEAAPYNAPRANRSQGLSGISVPSFSELRRGNFNDHMTKLFTAVGEDLPHVKQALAEAQQLGYHFVLYNPNDRSIPASVHTDLKRTSVFAVTNHEAKAVYISLDNIENFRQGLVDNFCARRSDTLNQMLIGTIAHESVHLLRRVSPTANNYRQVLQEEVLADVVEHIVDERMNGNPAYKLTSGELGQGRVRLPSSREDFETYKFQLARSLYTGADRQDEIDAFAEFINSGNIEGFVEWELKSKKYQLLAE